MKQETFLYLDGHTETHEIDNNAVQTYYGINDYINYRLDYNDATFEWHNNILMQINI